MSHSHNCFNKVTAEAATGGVLLKKDVLRNFAKFAGKHLCHSDANCLKLCGNCAFN